MSANVTIAGLLHEAAETHHVVYGFTDGGSRTRAGGPPGPASPSD